MLKIENITENKYKVTCDGNQLKLISNLLDIYNISCIGVNKFVCSLNCRQMTNLTAIIKYLYRDEYESLEPWEKYNFIVFLKSNRLNSQDKFVHSNSELSEKLRGYYDSWEAERQAEVCQAIFYNTGDYKHYTVINEIRAKKDKRHSLKYRYGQQHSLSTYDKDTLEKRLESHYYDSFLWVDSALSHWAMRNYRDKFTREERIYLFVNRRNESKVNEFIKAKKEMLESLESAQKLQDIHKVNEWQGVSRVMLLNLNTVLSKYFNKDITLNFDKNAPKINKQLKKLGIKPTQKENIAIGEFKKWLMCFESTASLYLDLDDFELPTLDQINRWAFQGSCHHRGGVGQNTANALKELGNYYYIRIYDYKKHAQARGYYKHLGYELAHAGMYSDFENRELNHTSYDAFSLILCALWGRKIDEFSVIEGNNLPEDDQIWCNMSNENDYITLGTSEILEDDCLEGYWEDEEDGSYSEFEGRFITQDEIDDGEYFYCDNVNDYVREDNTVFSEYEGLTLAYDCRGVCDNPVYSEKLDDWFSCEDTLLECAMG